MAAAAVVYGNYKSAIDTFEGGAGIRTVPGYSDTATAGIFCTYVREISRRLMVVTDAFQPQPFMSTTGRKSSLEPVPREPDHCNLCFETNAFRIFLRVYRFYTPNVPYLCSEGRR